jgi:glutamate--cysteine ligase
MENQVYGENYRIFVFGGEVMDIVERVRPTIQGDGIHTVEELILLRNKKQIEKKNYPTKVYSESYIQQQGYKLASVLPFGEVIPITNTINYVYTGALRYIAANTTLQQSEFYVTLYTHF